jgi:hypothetical protein
MQKAAAPTNKRRLSEVHLKSTTLQSGKDACAQSAQFKVQ